jgi:hypothetical protein
MQGWRDRGQYRPWPPSILKEKKYYGKKEKKKYKVFLPMDP